LRTCALCVISMSAALLSFAPDKQQNLAQLRSQIGQNYQTHPRLGFSGFRQGFPIGRLSEVSGQGKTEFISKFILEQKAGRVAWIEPHFTLNPFGLWQRGLKLKQFYFFLISEVCWLVPQILQSQLFNIVVIAHRQFEQNDLRRFQLMLEKSETIMIMLTEELHNSWVPALQIMLRRPSQQMQLYAEVVRERGL